MTLPADGTRALRGWLLANALFSGASGAGIVATSGVLPDLLGAGSRTLYLVLGGVLCLYALRLWWLSRRPVVAREVRLVVTADALWVLGSVVLIGIDALTPGGNLVVGAVAIVIAVFQWSSLRRVAHVDVRDTPVGSPNSTT